VDERIDYKTIEFLARDNPGSSVVLIGPILTAPPGELPSNVYLTGPREYADLPRYLKGFDVCILPFKRTELVSFISPTKTPEYLAGGRPVVSSFIPDVKEIYGDVVAIAESPEEFSEACRRAWVNSGNRQALCEIAETRAKSWNDIAGEMDSIIQQMPVLK
jgi:glycosyltransferase involved in cell wall biosynthesis